MTNKLFIGNLSYSVNESTLKTLFEQYGEVVACNIASDKNTGRPRGFAFVEMKTQVEAEGAISGLNGREVDGRQISVSISQPKPKSSSRW